MRNVIRAPRPGTIGKVSVTQGQPVKHHDLLVEYRG
jgi:biotin carboxyl carrier protein